jgi:hypothetical protein
LETAKAVIRGKFIHRSSHMLMSFFSTRLVVRAEQDLPGTEGGKAKREGEVEEGRV